MPKYVVQHGESVSYETVIVEAPDEETAEDIIRQSSPNDFNPRCEDGDNYNVEASEASENELKEYREVEVKDGAVVPFKKADAPKVIIEVRGGVAEITSQPDGVEVEIIDHDNA